MAAVARALLLALAAAPVASEVQSASTVCVYNAAAVILKWRLRDMETGREQAIDSAYPVGQVKCIEASALNASSGAKLLPVVKAVWGKEFKAEGPVLYDSANASQVTYVCHGVTFDFSCKVGPPPPTAFNVTKDIAKFTGGFMAGLLLELSGFQACLGNLLQTKTDIARAADLFQHGINMKHKKSIIQAFEIIAKLLLDFGNSIATCVAGYEDVVQMLLGVAAYLGGGVLKVIEIVVDEALHILHRMVDITSDCKAITSDWHVGDYFGSGKALGNLVAILAKDLVAQSSQTGSLMLSPPVAAFNTSSAVVVV